MKPLEDSDACHRRTDFLASQARIVMSFVDANDWTQDISTGTYLKLYVRNLNRIAAELLAAEKIIAARQESKP